MADIALRVVGAAVGFVASGFNPKGALIGYQIGATAGRCVMRDKLSPQFAKTCIGAEQVSTR